MLKYSRKILKQVQDDVIFDPQAEIFLNLHKRKILKQVQDDVFFHRHVDDLSALM